MSIAIKAYSSSEFSSSVPLNGDFIADLEYFCKNAEIHSLMHSFTVCISKG